MHHTQIKIHSILMKNTDYSIILIRYYEMHTIIKKYW